MLLLHLSDLTGSLDSGVRNQATGNLGIRFYPVPLRMKVGICLVVR